MAENHLNDDSIRSNSVAVNVFDMHNDKLQLPQRQMSVIATPVSISWHNITVTVENESKRRFCFSKKDAAPPKLILKEVNGQVKSGELLAIMGSSGAGKTTLINVLTGRNLSTVELTGEVRLNGKPTDINTITSLSAYVQQDDLFIGTLTVREHLKFQAQLRMPRDTTNKQRQQRVTDVLTELGLSKCKDTKIGWKGTVKGISGGEMKRLAFASEMLTNPSLMFCDEPTSGLDSFMAQSIVAVLKDMAAQGRTIVCTIHQPSSEVFAMFDKLLLMADGRVAYLGDSDKGIEFFASLNMRCPTNYNPADFYIQQLAIVPGNEMQCKTQVNSICDHYDSSTYANEAMPKSIRNNELKSFMSFDSSKKSGPSTMYRANWWTQFSALMWRAFLTVLREPMVTSLRIIQTIIISLLLGFIYWRQEYTMTGATNINGALYLILTNLSMQSSFAVINTFCFELPVFLREHNSGIYRVDAYYITKMIAELPIMVAIPMLFIGIFYYMVNLNNDFGTFIICMAISVLIANCGVSFGYLISCISSNVTMALSVAPPILIPLFIFGGLFINNATIPSWLAWLKYISWFYYGNEVLLINQWQNYKCISDPTFNNTCVEGKVILEKLSFVEDYFWRDIGLLFTLLIVMRFLAYIALLLRSRNR